MKPERVKARASMSIPVEWFSWIKKAIKLISKHSIPAVVNKDNRFHATSFPEEHCHAYFIK